MHNVLCYSQSILQTNNKARCALQPENNCSCLLYASAFPFLFFRFLLGFELLQAWHRNLDIPKNGADSLLLWDALNQFLLSGSHIWRSSQQLNGLQQARKSPSVGGMSHCKGLVGPSTSMEGCVSERNYTIALYMNLLLRQSFSKRMIAKQGISY